MLQGFAASIETDATYPLCPRRPLERRTYSGTQGG